MTGEPLIDEQHRELVDLINALGRLVVSGAPVADAPILDALDRFHAYAGRHFSEEDACAVSAHVRRSRRTPSSGR